MNDDNEISIMIPLDFIQDNPEWEQLEEFLKSCGVEVDVGIAQQGTRREVYFRKIDV